MESEDSKEKSEGYTEVFAWGADRYGQLGLGNKHGGRCYCIPRFCTFNVVIRRVACGEEHSAFITNNGSIYTMGSNADGRLGIGDHSIKLASTPCLVEALSRFNALEISCGWGHTAAVIDNGDVYTWGVGEYGALGISDSETQWFPVQMGFVENSKVYAKNVSCGTRHTAIVDDKGRLFVCGAGDAGQLGTGNRDRQLQPVHVSAIKENIVQSACGIFHTLALTSTGTVYAMGGNNFGQLGIGTKRSSTVPLQVKGFDKERAVKITAGHISAAVGEKGNLYVWGTGVFGEYLVPTQFTSLKAAIKDVEVGGNFGAAIDTNGVIYTWGSNTSGELGLGDYEARAQPVQVHALQGKPVTSISCGGSYAIALGRTIPHKYIPPSRTPTRAKEPNYETQKKEGLEEELKDAAPRISDGKKYMTSSGPDYEKYGKVGASPLIGQRKEKLHDELLEAYKSEQQKCKDLEKRISDLQDQIKISEMKIKDTISTEPDREIDIKLKERLADAEQALIQERQRVENLLKELDLERGKKGSLISEEASLERKVHELEEMADEIRKENQRVTEDKLAHVSGESTRLSELLKDYEDRIEKEIEERRRISREKTNEINALHDEISKIENTITAMQDDKTKLGDYYVEEIKKLELEIEVNKKTLNDKLLEKDKLIELKNKDEKANNLLDSDISRTNLEIADLQNSLKKLLDDLENAKHLVYEKENLIDDARKKQEELMSMLQEKELAYGKAITDLKDLEAGTALECEKLKNVLQEKINFNNEQQKMLLAKTVEIDTLNKDVNAWVEVANKTRDENTKLKQTIEDLENKNKKLMEALNLHMFNRAAEYKERTIKALKASQSPRRIDRLRSSGYKMRHVAPSPERFDKFLEEEKKTTEKGVSDIVQLTQFKAETTENIKKSGEGEPKPNFDGKFVIDQMDHKIEEDPTYVKSNYVLVQLLDKYDKPKEEQKEILPPVPQSEPPKETYATPKRFEEKLIPASAKSEQLIQSTQDLLKTLTPVEQVSSVYATPAVAKEKVFLWNFINIKAICWKKFNWDIIHCAENCNAKFSATCILTYFIII